MPANAASAAEPAAVPSDIELVITRMLDAPRALVFAAWTQTEHLARWQGAPIGHSVTLEKSDVRTGGSFRLCMHGPDGVDRWLEGDYKEVTPPHRIVFTHSWLDDHGDRQNETLVTITFADRGNRTELTLHQTGFVSIASRDGHRSGWNSTFDRFAAYLADLNTGPQHRPTVQS